MKHENDLSDTRKGDILAATGECPSPVVVSNLTGVVKVILYNSIRKNQRRLGVGFCVSKTMNYVNVSKKGTHNAGYFNVASMLKLTLYDGYWKKENKQIGRKTVNM